jgi:hypothetical protein
MYAIANSISSKPFQKEPVPTFYSHCLVCALHKQYHATFIGKEPPLLPEPELYCSEWLGLSQS